MSNEELKIIGEALDNLGNAVTSKDKNYWIGNAIQILSNLLTNE